MKKRNDEEGWWEDPVRRKMLENRLPMPTSVSAKKTITPAFFSPPRANKGQADTAGACLGDADSTTGMLAYISSSSECGKPPVIADPSAAPDCADPDRLMLACSYRLVINYKSEERIQAHRK